MNHVFDMDGTLVDTREAVVHAYRLAGVEMPATAWGQPWREWCDPAVHMLKIRAYPEMLELHARPLDCLAALKAICRTHEPYVLTGASIEAVNAIIKIFEIPKKARFKAGMSHHDKIHWLEQRTPGVYVDDDIRTRIMVRGYTRWQAMSPEAYLRSFWQLAPTPD